MERWLPLIQDPSESITVTVAGLTRVWKQWRFEKQRIHDHLLWVLVHGGCHGTVQGQPVQISAGDALWAGPDCELAFAPVPSGPRMRLYHFRFALDRAAPPRRGSRGWLRARLPPEVLATCATLRGQRHRPDRYRTPVERACLVQICAESLRGGAPTAAAGLTAGQQRLVEARCEQDDLPLLDSADLAAAAGLSRDYFVRRFTRSYGYPPRRWLVRQRILRAADELVDSQLSLGDAAERAGFPDVFTFAKRFKREMGLPPGRWRQS